MPEVKMPEQRAHLSRIGAALVPPRLVSVEGAADEKGDAKVAEKKQEALEAAGHKPGGG